MGLRMKFFLLATLLCSSAAFAQQAADTASPSPVGVWATRSDKTGQTQAHILIAERAGKLYGRIVKVLDPQAKPGELCIKCTDDRKNKAMASLEIIRGVDVQSDDGQWLGGRILDPQEGKEYRLKLLPQADGQHLGVRGYLGPFYRTQIWTRVTATKATPAASGGGQHF